MSFEAMPKMPFTKEYLEQPSLVVANILQRLLPDVYYGDNRRCEERVPVTIVVPAYVLDEFGRPIDPQLRLLTRNISTKGISLLHTEEIDAEHLALALPDGESKSTQVLVKILHSRKIEQAFEMGGKFVSKLTC